MEKWWHRARHRMGDIGMTQEQLAERFDMTTGGMQKWLAGKREPSLDRINEIAAVLGVPGSYLTHGVTPDDLATAELGTAHPIPLSRLRAAFFILACYPKWIDIG